MGILRKLMPTRDAHKPVKIIADLDLLISQPIGFKYLGKDYVIEPMSTENFIEITQSLHDMEVLLKTPGTSQDDLYLAYYQFIHPLCKSMTLEDIKEAKLPQLHGIMALLIKHIKGETQADMVEETDTEKKKMK